MSTTNVLPREAERHLCATAKSRTVAVVFAFHGGTPGKHVHGYELRLEDVYTSAPRQRLVPSGSLRGVQSLQGEVYEVPEGQQLRQLQVPTAVQRLPGVPHGPSADGQGAPGEAGIQGPDGSPSQPSGQGNQTLTTRVLRAKRVQGGDRCECEAGVNGL